MNLKAMYEKRAALIAEMNTLIEGAVNETRAMTAEESAALEAKKAELSALDATIDAAEEERGIRQPKTPAEPPKTETRAQKDEREFRAYIVDAVEHRAGEQNMTIGANGAVVPVTIADRIITTMREISPLLARATIYREKGTLKIPVWGNANTTHNITVAYGEDFSELTADAGAFTSVDLSGYLIGALTLIGRRLINSAAFDVVGFIVSEMARRFADFLEKEGLNGTASKIAGLSGATNVKAAAATNAITADELIDTQALVFSAYQGDAAWIMSTATFSAIRKLKDGNNRYLLQDDFTSDFPYRLLGKPVFISDNMPAASAGGVAAYYGDFSGLAVNFREDINLQLLVEKYATQHAIGLVGWCEADMKVADNQRIAVLKYKAS